MALLALHIKYISTKWDSECGEHSSFCTDKRNRYYREQFVRDKSQTKNHYKQDGFKPC